MDIKALEKKIKLEKEYQKLKNALRHSYKKYYFDDESKQFFYKVNQNIDKGVPFERPDMYIALDNEIVAIEHFEFDSSNVNKKGSYLKNEIANIERELDKERQETNKKYLAKKCTFNGNKENYEKNFLKNFNNHYNKIEEYKSNIAKIIPDIPIHICFYIIDETEMGNIILNDENHRAYIPFMNKTILEKIENATNLDYIIFQNKEDYYLTNLYFFKNNKQGMNHCKSEYKDYFDKDIEAINFTRTHSIYSFYDG